MELVQLTAKHFRDVFFGGNWTVSNLADTVKEISWQQSVTQLGKLNTIATLVFHIDYFLVALLDVLEHRSLTSNDLLSFSHPPINSQEQWQELVDKTLSNAAKCADLIEQLQESDLKNDFYDAKYGSYFRNIHGIIEHTHYHLGQIALLKKLIQKN